MLDALRIPVSRPGYEADDVIATLATQAVEQGMDVLIVTGDRDALQLVNDARHRAVPAQGASRDMTRFTPEEVEAKYGLTPAQYPDFAALRGDPSDNLPASRAWGRRPPPSGSREYGSLDALVDQVDEVKGKAGEKLREHLSDVLRNRRLTELDRDVPLDVGPARPAPGSRGTATRCTPSSTPCSSGCCATGCRHAATAAPSREAERRLRGAEAFDVTSPAGPGEVARLAGRARAAAAGPAWSSAAPGAGAPAS